MRFALFGIIGGLEKPACDATGAKVKRFPVARGFHAEPRFGETNDLPGALGADLLQRHAGHAGVGRDIHRRQPLVMHAPGEPA
jgi:hypothetical protein